MDWIPIPGGVIHPVRFDGKTTPGEKLVYAWAGLDSEVRVVC